MQLDKDGKLVPPMNYDEQPPDFEEPQTTRSECEFQVEIAYKANKMIAFLRDDSRATHS